MSDLELDPEFEALLNYVKRDRGFDFTGYKRSTLIRRVQKCMQAVGIESYSDYMDYLEVHPEEFAHLFNTIFINVTSFFRDYSAWEYISREIVPRIAARKEPNEPIRVWSAGCASGQEAYTLAIVLAEALGIERFRSSVKIYATDVDEEALDQARHAAYSPGELGGVSAELIERYFEATNHHYTFRKDLRRCAIFGRHDLVQDAPISRIDLLVCRNSLMYFNAETQAKILTRFHFALSDGGFLFLGKAEMLLTHNNSFMPVDLKQRIFSKVSKGVDRERLRLLGQNRDDEADDSSQMHLRDAAFDASPVAQIVVALNGSISSVNERARMLFGLTLKDLNRPLQDLEISYQPVELRSCIDRAYAKRCTISLKDVEWTTTSGENLYFDVQAIPLSNSFGNLLGVNVSFTDVTRPKRLQEELEHSNQELEMAYEELQSTNEDLETTNEELQSSNEELETTNEELQSTNEELETMNEELQSSNEELQTINEELHLRSEELNRVNAFLELILTNMRSGVVVLDPELHIQIWNHKNEDLWGLRSDEVQGQHFLNLDIGLPVEQLRQPLRSCLAGEPESVTLTLKATNRRGKAIQCEVTSTALVNPEREIRGVIMLLEELSKE